MFVIFLVYLLWPVLVFILLVKEVAEEYFGCCRRKRWRKYAGAFRPEESIAGGHRQGQAQAQLSIVTAIKQPIVEEIQDNNGDLVINV